MAWWSIGPILFKPEARMRIGLNLLYVAGGLAGGKVYAEGLLGGLAEVDTENEYVVFTRPGIELPVLPADRFRRVNAPVSDTSVLGRTVWEYGVLPHRARREGVELLHGLGSLSPVPHGAPLVLTIHDLIYREYPGTVPLGHRLFLSWVLPRVARQAERIIVPSQATAREVVRHLRVAEERVRVVMYGPGNDLAPVEDGQTRETVLDRYGIRRPFVLSVCRTYPHKNMAGLLRAYAALPAALRKHAQLVLVGEQLSVGRLDALASQLGIAERLVMTGFVDRRELASLYSSAAVFAFPSLAEGFGLPLLEAMACGTPLVASNASAVPEAVGPAGLLADARQPEAFAAALRSVLEDEGLQARLREKGLMRVRAFSWRRCAEETLAVYREAVGMTPASKPQSAREELEPIPPVGLSGEAGQRVAGNGTGQRS
jgi:glycosyltransferase involved in cell wall biosynthesis